MDKSRGDERYAKERGEKELERTGDTVLSEKRREQGTLFCSMTQTLELKGRRAFIVAC
jgi:hypothetical protein